MSSFVEIVSKIFPGGQPLRGLNIGNNAVKYALAVDGNGIGHVCYDRQTYTWTVGRTNYIGAHGGRVIPSVMHNHYNGLGQALGDTSLGGDTYADVPVNTSFSSRTLNYTIYFLKQDDTVIDSVVWNVIQEGRGTSPISVEISGVPVAASGGYATVNVTYTEQWSITSYPNFVSRITVVEAGDESEFSGTGEGNTELRFYLGSNSGSSAVPRSGSIVFADDFGSTASATISQYAYNPSVVFEVVPNWLILENYEEAIGTVRLRSNTNWHVVSILFQGEEEEGEVPTWDASYYLSVTPSSGNATSQSGILLSIVRTRESEWTDNIVVAITNGADTINLTVSEFEEP